jgi:predicted MFS family arabinose efflux permease
VAVEAATLRHSLGLERARAWVSRVAGGPARGRVVVLFACVLALQTADLGTIGAVATQLESSLRITHTELGLLATTTALVGAVATIPLGLLADRVKRVPVLAASIVLWSAALVASGAADSYGMLLMTRLALGVVIAAAGPMLGSLVGDLFPPRERARIFGYMLTGELAGSGLGLLISGAISAALGWRAAFWILALPGLLLAAAIARLLPEPARGGQSRLEPGAREIRGVDDDPADRDSEPTSSPGAQRERVDRARRAVREEAVSPRPELVLHSNPADMSLWSAIRYVLRVPTNVLLIVASGLGYFFFAGVNTFAVVFVRAQYGLGQAPAVLALSVLFIGALAGVLLGGRLADRLLDRGRIDARIMVGAVAYVAAAAIFVPGLLVPWLALALPLYLVATAALSAANPPLDAARLDIMHSRLRGRAEGVRTTVRTLGVAAAPLLFGVIADQLGGSIPDTTERLQTIPASAGHGLAYTFLIMLVPLACAGVILMRARRTYPRDLATAAASEVEAERRPREAEGGRAVTLARWARSSPRSTTGFADGSPSSRSSSRARRRSRARGT